MSTFDIIIVGSGPAGVSAAFPLVEAGLNVLMLDAAEDKGSDCPVLLKENFLDMQPSIPVHDRHTANGVSPKLKMQGVPQALEHFKRHNHIVTENFEAAGILAEGGLSTIWGAGVACYDDKDLFGWPISYADLAPAYIEITKRIGISGSIQCVPSDVSAFIQPALKLDGNHQHLLHRFVKKSPASLQLWESHNAVLSEHQNDRFPCNYSGLCLWGCERRSIWNAKMDLDKLKLFPNFNYISGVFVEKLKRVNGMWRCLSSHQDSELFTSYKILLAAGAIGSTRIVLSTLEARETSVTLQSNPSAAFMLWLPRRLKSLPENAYGMAQLSFSDQKNTIYGNLFSATMIPRSEYLSASILPNFILNPVLSKIMSSSVIGNCFFGGNLSGHSLRLLENGDTHIRGGYQIGAHSTFSATKKLLAGSFQKLGAMMIPSSFRMSEKGADIHYAATLPMQENPLELQTHSTGQLAGHEGLYIVDGAILPSLPAKPLTLTIMANAHRIAQLLALQIK